jgi:nitrate/nitrite transport system substrate-binding protein
MIRTLAISLALAATVSAVEFTPYTPQSKLPNLKRAIDNKLEKKALKFGFIKLTDCVPLVVAKENGYFADEGLNVTLEVQSNWKLILERTMTGDLDGAHMLCGQPIAASIGYGAKGDFIVAHSLDLNGNGITVSPAVWAAMQETEPRLKEPGHAHPISAASMKPLSAERRAAGKPLTFGMVFPVSCHNYELRYWLAAGGLNPGFYAGYDDPVGNREGDMNLSVTPPPQMPQTLAQGTIDGYCVGEPWNQQAVASGIGIPVAVDSYIWKDNPEKVLGVTRAWADANPNTLVAVVKALIRAGHWLDASMDNRKKAVEMLAHQSYIGANPQVLAASMLGTFEFEKGDIRPLPDYNIFYAKHATYPLRSHCVWYLTQMRRWGQIPENKPDSWYAEQSARIYRPDIYRTAFAALVAEKAIPADDLPGDDYPAVPGSDFIDGIAFDPKQPNAYLASFPIGRK